MLFLCLIVCVTTAKLAWSMVLKFTSIVIFCDILNKFESVYSSKYLLFIKVHHSESAQLTPKIHLGYLHKIEWEMQINVMLNISFKAST